MLTSHYSDPQTARAPEFSVKRRPAHTEIRVAMSTPTYIDDQDRLERSLNSFATESFRDQADRDYILARLACRHELFPQFIMTNHYIENEEK